MRLSWKNSLLYQYIAVVSIIFILLSPITVAITAAVTHKRANAAATVRLNQLIDTVDSTLRVACFVGDKALAGEVAHGLLNNSEVQAVVIRADKNELAHLHRAGVPEAAVDHPAGLKRDIRSPFNARQVIGQIQLSPHYEFIEQQSREEVRFVALQLVWQLALIALGVIVAMLMFILRPIKLMSDRLHHLDAKGGERLSAPRGHTHTEIGRLVNDVNRLAEDLVESLYEERTLRLQREIDEKKYHAIFDHAESGIFILGADGLVSSWNPAFTRLLELPSGVIREGVLRLDALPWKNPWRLTELIRESLYDNTAVSEDLSLLLESDVRRWLKLDLNPIGIDLLQGVVTDITARKQAEDELRLLNKTLAQRVAEETAKNIEQERILTHHARQAAMGEMIGNIAHQWRQPLNALGLVMQNIFIDYQEGSLDAKSLAEYQDKALDTIHKMSQTIDDFRNFFKPNRPEEVFNLVRPIQDTLKLIDAGLKNDAISVTVDCPESLIVLGRQNEFSQVMLNLLANAKDALLEKSMPQKKIEVSVEAKGRWVHVSVRDNGGGIPAEIMEHIFDPYFTSKENGTGIGLYITKVIVEQHMHGQIICRNTDEGAEFALSFPRKKDQD